jgi:ferritin-like metal-binding protein YciE
VKKKVVINGKKHTIKTREVYAPLERVVDDVKKYKRSKEKNKIKKILEEDLK